MSGVFPHRRLSQDGGEWHDTQARLKLIYKSDKSDKKYFSKLDEAKSIRQVLFMAQEPFDPVEVHDEGEWKEYASNGACLEVGGYTMRQGIAILRYVAKLAGFYPTDAYDAMACDEIVYTIREFRNKIKSTTRKSTKCSEFNQVIGDKIQEVSGKYCVGDHLTIADLEMMALWDYAAEGRIMGLDKEVFNDCGKFKDIRNAILENTSYLSVKDV